MQFLIKFFFFDNPICIVSYFIDFERGEFVSAIRFKKLK